MYLNRNEQVEWYERLAKIYDKWARQSGDDDNGRQKWTDQANACWAKARELKGA